VNPLIVVEDDPSLQGRLRSILEGALGLAHDHLCFAESMADACHLVGKRPFGLAVVDIGVVGLDGTETIRSLHWRDSTMPILALSGPTSRQTVLAALQAGARGYLLKERNDFEIALYIRSVMQGGCPIDPFVAGHILDMARQAAPILPPGFPPPSLSPREVEVLHLVAKGFANREVSNLLHLSVLTVECHMKNIYRKLEVKSRTQAVFEARAVGLIP
jgi:DNA-binding NarL/FixJ family response regulator